jgi:hypothetical protein
MKKYLFISMIAFAVMGVGCNKTSENINQSSKDQIVSIQSSADISNWQTYANTKYLYTIKYPLELKILATGIGMGVDGPITPISDQIVIRNSDNNLDILGVSTQALSDESKVMLSEEYIASRYPADSRNQFSFKKVQIGNLDGYRLDLGDVNKDYYHYYFQTPAGDIIMLTVRKDNSTANDVLSTLKFK